MDILYNINPLVLGVIGGVFTSQISILLYRSYNLLCKSKEDRDNFVIEHILENEENIQTFEKHVMEKTCENLDRRSAELIKLQANIKSKLSEIFSNINRRGNYKRYNFTHPPNIYKTNKVDNQVQKLVKEKKSWNMEDTYLCGNHPVTKLPFHCHPQTVKCSTGLRQSRTPFLVGNLDKDKSESTHLRERFLRDSVNKPALQATVRRHSSINPYHRDQYMRTFYTRKHPEQLYSERLEKTEDMIVTYDLDPNSSSYKIEKNKFFEKVVEEEEKTSE